MCRRGERQIQKRDRRDLPHANCRKQVVDTEIKILGKQVVLDHGLAQSSCLSCLDCSAFGVMRARSERERERERENEKV